MIPLRIDGVSARVSGTFRRVAPPSGTFAPRLLGSSELGPGVELQLLRGEQPGVYLENRSATRSPSSARKASRSCASDPTACWPMCRARRGSPAAGRATTSETRGDARSPPRGTQRSPVPRFSWLDPADQRARRTPRGAARSRSPAGGQNGRFAYLLGDERGTVAGGDRLVPGSRPRRRRRGSRTTDLRNRHHRALALSRERANIPGMNRQLVMRHLAAMVMVYRHAPLPTTDQPSPRCSGKPGDLHARRRDVRRRLFYGGGPSTDDCIIRAIATAPDGSRLENCVTRRTSRQRELPRSRSHPI